MAPATCYRLGAIGLGAGLTGLVFIVFDVAVRGMDPIREAPGTIAVTVAGWALFFAAFAAWRAGRKS